MNQPIDQPGSYWADLAADQAAGTYTICRCGERNPATYDVCHSCQQPIPDTPAHPDTGKVFQPGDDDMEGRYGGILVASLGEDGAAIALTGVKSEALAALDAYYRQVCGQPNILDEAGRTLTDAYYALDCGHARFMRRRDGGWDVMECAPDTPGAVQVTWWTGQFGRLPEPRDYLAPAVISAVLPVFSQPTP